MESTLKLAEERSFNVTEGRTLVQKFMAMEHHEAALRALMRLATLAERKHELTVDEVEYNRQQQADEVGIPWSGRYAAQYIIDSKVYDLFQ